VIPLLFDLRLGLILLYNLMSMHKLLIWLVELEIGVPAVIGGGGNGVIFPE
jgi:hypothetical protein